MDLQLKYGGTFLIHFGWNYLYHKAWYKQKLQPAEKHQLGAKVTKMAEKNKIWIILYGNSLPDIIAV